MKNMRRICALLIAVLLLAVSAAPALAASAYTGKTGKALNVTERLYLENADIVLEDDDSISYTIAFDWTGNSAHKPLDEDGNDTIDSNCFSGEPTITAPTVTFTNASTKLGSGTADYSKYYEANFVLDFSGVTFFEPGIYRYNLTKTKSLTTTSSVTAIKDNDLTNNRSSDYVLVYVASDSNTATLLEPQYVFQNITNQHAAARPIDKEYLDKLKLHHTDLRVTKTVAGSMGSKSQYFEFTINLTGGPTAATDPTTGVQTEFHKYKVTWNSSTFDETTKVTAYDSTQHDNIALLGINKETRTNSAGEDVEEAFITLAADGTYTGTVWLRHGQSLLIDELPAGMNFNISETAVSDYTTEASGDGTVSSDKRSISGQIPNDDAASSTVQTEFTNTKIEPALPTGISLQTAAPVFGILLTLALLAIVLHGKRKENDA